MPDHQSRALKVLHKRNGLAFLPMPYSANSVAGEEINMCGASIRNPP